MEDTEVPVEEDSVSQSAIERLRQLINNSGQKGTKIKFTVDMEEKEKDGHSELRIDVWEVKDFSLASPITTEPPHMDPLETSVLDKGTPRTEGNGDSGGIQENLIPPFSDLIMNSPEEKEQLELNLTIGGEIPSFNE